MDNLYPKLVNTARNKELILYRRCPAKRLGTLTVILNIRVELPGNNGNILVTEELLDTLGISKEEAIRKAYENLKRESFTFKLRDMNGIIRDLLKENAGEVMEDVPEVSGMYVLTNSTGFYGATAILDEGTRKSIRDRIGDYYVLPSSVHEVILVPVSYGSDPYELREMVKSVNATQVADEDYLSDEVYIVTDEGFREAIGNGYGEADLTA